MFRFLFFLLLIVMLSMLSALVIAESLGTVFRDFIKIEHHEIAAYIVGGVFGVTNLVAAYALRFDKAQKAILTFLPPIGVDKSSPFATQVPRIVMMVAILGFSILSIVMGITEDSVKSYIQAKTLKANAAFFQQQKSIASDYDNAIATAKTDLSELDATVNDLRLELVEPKQGNDLYFQRQKLEKLNNAIDGLSTQSVDLNVQKSVEDATGLDGRESGKGDEYKKLQYAHETILGAINGLSEEREELILTIRVSENTVSEKIQVLQEQAARLQLKVDNLSTDKAAALASFDREKLRDPDYVIIHEGLPAKINAFLAYSADGNAAVSILLVVLTTAFIIAVDISPLILAGMCKSFDYEKDIVEKDMHHTFNVSTRIAAKRMQAHKDIVRIMGAVNVEKEYSQYRGFAKADYNSDSDSVFTYDKAS